MGTLSALTALQSSSTTGEGTIGELANWAAILTFLILVITGLWRFWHSRRSRYSLRLSPKTEDQSPIGEFQPQKQICLTGDYPSFSALAYGRDDYEIRACKLRLVQRYRFVRWKPAPNYVLQGFDFGDGHGIARPTGVGGWWWTNVPFQVDPGKPLSLRVTVKAPENGWRGHVEFGGIDKRDKWSFARATLHVDCQESPTGKRAREMFAADGGWQP